MFDTDILWGLIPLAPFFVGGIAIWTRHQQKMIKMKIELARSEAEIRSAGSDRLAQRVQVLERIITEGKHDLAREIEDLRNEPLN